MEGNAFVFRGLGFFYLSAVKAILGVSGEAKVGGAVIEGMVIAMVNEEAGRGIEYFAVHLDSSKGAKLAKRHSSAGIEVAIVFDDVPFEFAKPEEVGRVNDGKFAFCKGDKADILAEADTVKKI